MLRFSRRALQFRSAESVGNRRKTPKFCSIDGLNRRRAARGGFVTALNVHSRARGLP